jgi:hypothetical protein
MCFYKVCAPSAVVGLQTGNGAIVGLETPDGDQTFAGRNKEIVRQI